MIGVLDVEIQAANPLMPLYPLRAYVNSPSSVRVRNVPKKIGDWNITEVQITAAYPDNSIKTANCVRIGCVWVGTIEGSTLSGKSENGFTIYANGIDENGNAVNGYVLGKGLVEILENDGTITPGQDTHYVHMLDDVPTSPKEGDLWNDNGTWYIYQDGTSYPIGDDSGLIEQLSARVDGVETALSRKADKSQLASYELKANMQNDVSSIVTARETTDWNYPEKIGDYWYAPNSGWIDEHGDHSKIYYCMEEHWNATGHDDWLVVLYRYAWDGSMWSPIGDMPIEEVVDAPEDTLTLDCTFYLPEQGYVEIVLTRENVNALGLAMMTDLETKQDKLSDPQISAIDSVVDERATVITFTDNTTSAFNWSGTITRYTMIDAGLFDGDEDHWIKSPTSVKIGTTVTVIGDQAFGFAYDLSSVTIPDSVTSIGDEAFYNCFGLTNMTIPDSVTSIGIGAFEYCAVLTSIIVKGKTQAQAETLLANAGVSPSIITTWNDASQEWVNSQLSAQLPRYAFVAKTEQDISSSTLTIQPYTNTSLTSTGTTFELAIASSGGYVRDCIFTLTCGATPPTGIFPNATYVGADGDAQNLVADANATIMFIITEYQANKFIVAKQVIGGAS